MTKKLIIFLLFYLVGAAVSPVFGEMGFDSDKNFILTLAEDAAEGGESYDELLKNPQNSDWNNIPFSACSLTHKSDSSIIGYLTLGQQLIQNERAIPNPLYLLFHSFLFYELI